MSRIWWTAGGIEYVIPYMKQIRNNQHFMFYHDRQYSSTSKIKIRLHREGPIHSFNEVWI